MENSELFKRSRILAARMKRMPMCVQFGVCRMRVARKPRQTRQPRREPRKRSAAGAFGVLFAVTRGHSLHDQYIYFPPRSQWFLDEIFAA